MKRVITGLMVVLISAFLTACNEEETTPEDRLSEYIELWNDSQFHDMYSEYLSSSSKETYSEEDMANRYEKLYADLGIEDVNVTFEAPEEEQSYEDMEEATFPIHVEMNSLAGPISFDHEITLVKESVGEEEHNWFVNWDTTYIFKQLEDGDTVGIDMKEAPRGEIFDRNGKGLAINDTLTLIGLVPQSMEGHEQETKEKVAELLHLDVEYIDQQLNQEWVKPDVFVPIRTINPNDEDLFQELIELPGVWSQDQVGRLYPLGEAATHLVGYIGEITAEELEKNKGKGYTTGDMIGKRGLEQLFEEDLRGSPGAEIYITKENGDKVLVASKNAKKGKDIHLTIDATIQETIYEQIQGEKGTAAAIHPETGETLALVSAPSFDPNGLTSNYYAKLMEDERNPLLNRFTSLYAPGSAFKPITASIALSNGTITPDTTRDIQGETWSKGDEWGNYKIRRVTDPGHPVDLEDALVYSDNIYFAQTALELGSEAMVQGLENFGFQEDLPFAYPVAASTISNSGELNDEILLADTGYGQGELQVSMIHLATMYTPIFNHGDLVKPKLLKDVATEVWKEQIISAEQANMIHDALRNVVASPEGTARGANLPDIPLAGKTGTAEIKTSQGESGKENGIFVAYDYEKKDLLIAMLLEDVEDQGGSAAVVDHVKKIFQKLYE
ncbi:penicillin-binding protein [Melghiribacillus thermohalophilus]|uniref:serine-type D-Ala-D-Ala carboxypeptidase n=1 Tax=Melghiribacillus thermohalophilus TaxID=1324956 RepID=A0A4R3NC25_9BACI|nr:penicillin-binding transpeptidase domain-containing protein [Melghiribacillus thermohalophilus]TCT24649.1 penicillin-binding protein [Melghiribacillus thermohalophilus]